MRIEQVCELHEYSPNETGDFHLYDDDVEIGVLEYHIDSSHGVLHIDNLKNKAAGVYSGVGSALMNEAVKLSLSKHVGFLFEIAKGSEPFYQSWIPASFARDDSDRRASGLFQRISLVSIDKNYKRLTSQNMTYTFHQLERNCKIDMEASSIERVRPVDSIKFGA